MSDQPTRIFAHTDIDRDTAARLLRRCGFRSALSELERIPQGTSTSNYAVTLTDGRRVLLKLYPENGGDGALEAAAYRNARRLLPVPEVLWFDGSLAEFHRPWMVLQWIDGMPLGRYIAETGSLPDAMARTIAGRLALLHRREYPRMALLDASLNPVQDLIPVADLPEYYLNGEAGSLIDGEIRDAVLAFLRQDRELTARLEHPIVLCHGDCNPGNILVDRSGEVWFIDFEYSIAAPPPHDVGKFFRDREGVSDRFTPETYQSFFEGYNAVASTPLDEDWYRLARLIDMTNLLHLLTHESMKPWAGEIGREIRHTLRVLQGIDPY